MLCVSVCVFVCLRACLLIIEFCAVGAMRRAQEGLQNVLPSIAGFASVDGSLCYSRFHGDEARETPSMNHTDDKRSSQSNVSIPFRIGNVI